MEIPVNVLCDFQSCFLLLKMKALICSIILKISKDFSWRSYRYFCIWIEAFYSCFWAVVCDSQENILYLISLFSVIIMTIVSVHKSVCDWQQWLNKSWIMRFHIVEELTLFQLHLKVIDFICLGFALQWIIRRGLPYSVST